MGAEGEGEEGGEGVGAEEGEEEGEGVGAEGEGEGVDRLHLQECLTTETVRLAWSRCWRTTPASLLQ